MQYSNQPDPAFLQLKDNLKAMWSDGDYGYVAEGLRPGARDFYGRNSAQAGERVLDVACGTGQVALMAARDGADVTGLDLAKPWIDEARRRAAAEGIDATFDVGDAEALPYDDASFDVVYSLIGAMFAPRPQLVADELLRVCRPGGRIVMGNWTAEGLIGDFFRTVANHVPPPDMPSPLLWGDEATVRGRFDAAVSDLGMSRHMLRIAYDKPPVEAVDAYFAHFGPTKKASEVLDPEGREALRADLIDLFNRANLASDGRTELDGEILDVVAIRA